MIVFNYCFDLIKLEEDAEHTKSCSSNNKDTGGGNMYQGTEDKAWVEIIQYS